MDLTLERMRAESSAMTTTSMWAANFASQSMNFILFGNKFRESYKLLTVG